MNLAATQSPALEKSPHVAEIPVPRASVRYYRVWSPDYGQVEKDAQDIVQYSAKGAAEQWARAQDWQNNEPKIASGLVVTVFVRGTDGATQQFQVSAAPSITYLALPQ